MPEATNTHEKNEFHDRLLDLIPGLRRFALSLTGSESDRDDLVQATLERAITRREQLDERKSLNAWVFSILHSVWKNELRSRSVRRGNGLVDTDMLEDQNALSNMESQHVLDQVRQHVQQLPDAQRAAVMLVDVEGMSYRDAAAALEIPQGTLMSRLSRARQTLIGRLRETELPQSPEHSHV